MNLLKSELTENQAHQLELLMSESRSTQVLMDKTLGTASLIDSTNIPYLLEQMKRALAAEAHATADQRVGDIRKQTKAEKRSLEAVVEAEQARSADLSRRVGDYESREALAISTVLGRLNERVRRRKRLFTYFLILIAVLAQAGGYWGSGFSTFWSLVTFGIIAVVGVAFLFVGYLQALIHEPFKLKDELWFIGEADAVGLNGTDLNNYLSFDGRAYFLSNGTVTE